MSSATVEPVSELSCADSVAFRSDWADSTLPARLAATRSRMRPTRCAIAPNCPWALASDLAPGLAPGPWRTAPHPGPRRPESPGEGLIVVAVGAALMGSR